MATDTQETKLDNLRIQEAAKAKVLEVVEAYKEKMGVKPTHSEAIMLMGNHYLKHLAEAA
jgi:hypothetical protein